MAGMKQPRPIGSRLIERLLPDADAETIARARETLEAFFTAIYDVCEELLEAEAKEARDKNESCDTLDVSEV